MARKISKPLQASQILFKQIWIPTKNGGQVRGFEWEKEGDHLLVIANIEDVAPGIKLYMQDVYNTTKFYETSFSNGVQWDSVIELINSKRYYIERSDAKPNKEPSKSNRKRTGSSHGGSIQTGLLFD